MPHSKLSIRAITHGLLIAALTATACAQSGSATPYYFTTLAGASSIGSTNGVGSAARFYQSQGIAVDASGNLYVADSDNDTIRKISSSGVVTTLAGSPGQPGSADGIGGLARFDFPSSIAVDSLGNSFVADANNHAIRKITPAGMVTTFAGAVGVSGSTDGNGGLARFNRPEGLGIDAAGNLYVADAGNNLIRKISPAGIVSTLAGTAGTTGATDGTGSAARFSLPFRIAVDPAGTLYVSEAGNYDIRKITVSGTVTTLFSGNFNYLYGSRSVLNFPTGIAVTSSGRIFFADRYTNSIWEISPAGVVIPFAGSGTPGNTDGSSTTARFNEPTGLATDTAGNLYVADTYNNSIRKITTAGVVTTFAGLSPFQSAGATDGVGTSARFYAPSAVAVTSDGTSYVADIANHVIRKISREGVVSTLAGVAGQNSYADGAGSQARFNWPWDLALDSVGNLYVVDASKTVRKVTPAGVVSTLAGTANSSGMAVDGQGTSAVFDGLMSIAVDPGGDIYVSDYKSTGSTSYNNRIRKITPAGAVTTESWFLQSHSMITGLAFDSAGTLYACDPIYRQLYKRNSNALETVRFDSFAPYHVAVASSGQIFLTDGVDYDTCRVGRLTTGGQFDIIGGRIWQRGHQDGLGADALFLGAGGIAADDTGAIYIACADNTIRKGQLAGPPIIATQPLNQTVPPATAVQFSVTASALPAPTYQWYFNGSAFSGATTNMLSFTNARSADAGDYTVVVTNELGSATSTKATLTISSASVTSPSTPAPAAGGGGSIEAWFVLGVLAIGVASRGGRRGKR